MKLTFTKGSQKIVIDDRGKGINNILTTNSSQTHYPQIKLVKGGTTRYFKTKWEVSFSQKIVNNEEVVGKGKFKHHTKASEVPTIVRNNFISGEVVVNFYKTGGITAKTINIWVYFDQQEVARFGSTGVSRFRATSCPKYIKAIVELRGRPEGQIMEYKIDITFNGTRRE